MTYKGDYCMNVNVNQLSTGFTLDRNQMKYAVIILMLFDHLIYFLPPTNPAFFWVNVVSRLTAPTMALFIAQGYYYTRSVPKYIKRMLLFAIISYIPYCLCFYGQLLPIQLLSGNVAFNPLLPNGVADVCAHLYIPFINSTLVILQSSVILTLLLGLLSICVVDSDRISKYLKLPLLAIIFWISTFCDWQFYLPLLCLVFYFLRNNRKLMWICYSIVILMYTTTVTFFSNPFAFGFSYTIVLFGLGGFLIPLFFSLYNGEGGKKSAFNKWFFYLFYPGHLLLIGLMRLALGIYC